MSKFELHRHTFCYCYQHSVLRLLPSTNLVPDFFCLLVNLSYSKTCIQWLCQLAAFNACVLSTDWLDHVHRLATRLLPNLGMPPSLQFQAQPAQLVLFKQPHVATGSCTQAGTASGGCTPLGVANGSCTPVATATGSCSSAPAASGRRMRLPSLPREKRPEGLFASLVIVLPSASSVCLPLHIVDQRIYFGPHTLLLVKLCMSQTVVVIPKGPEGHFHLIV